MAIDYFIKWIKVEALVTITEINIENFVWRPIVYGFNIIRVLVIDNGKQFNNQMCKEFYTTQNLEPFLLPCPSPGQLAGRSDK